MLFCRFSAEMTTETQSTAAGPFREVDDSGIAWITFNDPARKLNVLTEAVMTSLAEVIADVADLGRRGEARVAVVRSGKPTSFIAGADVSAIKAVESPEEGSRASQLGQEILRALEVLPIPTVAAIHGICLGGGLEMSLACTRRVASDSPKTKLGLPEVQLGILPAWGGTTRLPRLIGLQAALDLLLTGRNVSSSRARKLGLVDEIFPAALFERKAAEFALALAEGASVRSRRKPISRRLLENTSPGRWIVHSTARKQVLAKTGGHYPAPLRILEVVRSSRGRSLERAFELEAAAAGELIASGVSKNLIHVFHLREAARKGISEGGEPATVSRMGVLGAGVMGGGIAQLAAYNGIRVRVKDIRHEAVSGALRHARSLFDRSVRRRRLSSLAAGQRMELISGGIDYDGFGQLDLVVEAIVEKMEVKRSVLAEVEARTSPDCVITSNTSTLTIDGMAQALARPERFVGMHFFNPVHKMPLVEVVRGSRTTDQAVAAVYALALRLGKVPVVTRDGPGFLVNRILGPYLNEAGFLLEEGATIDSIDQVALEFGMPMGPLRLIDEVGIDIMRHAGATLHEALGDRLAPASTLVALGESGRLGRKGGSGFYTYEDGKEKGMDSSVYGHLGPRRAVGSTDSKAIRARLVLAMINEAARVLDEEIVSTAGDVDLGMIMGTGYPPFRGGLLRYADSVPLRTVLDRLVEYEKAVGERFAPAPLLVRLVDERRGFYEAFPGS